MPAAATPVAAATATAAVMAATIARRRPALAGRFADAGICTAAGGAPIGGPAAGPLAAVDACGDGSGGRSLVGPNRT
ncbi:hypothetical protein [Phytohabitans houttuyneae]|uniref:hypothetical protein n=1 Tax=Phytohabitans houttuyneae TaxID=1076126 RepID=UPI001C498B78|nr:hypothetical protein [Phytohabitans houttuyneae]